MIKFGGADLSDGERIRDAAKMIVESGYDEIVVVVSAMGETTDSLVKTMSHMDISEKDYAEIVSMGERTSARIFSSALKNFGRDSVYFEPNQDNWPITTNSNFKNAIPDLERTKDKIEEHILPILKNTIPVVCGFLGKDVEDRITTFGRGGSDTTALLIANCIGADEVILVKDTNGVLSADPNVVKDAEPFDSIDIQDMFALAHGGAQIVRHEALRYKLPDQILRIASFSSEHLDKGGTEISGVFGSESTMINKMKGLSAITVICDINSKNIANLFGIIDKLSRNTINGVSTGKRSITVFVKIEKPQVVINKLHESKKFKAITLREAVGMIEVTHPIFVDSPGWVAEITKFLSIKEINLIEVTTSKATISLFIDENDRKETACAIEEALEKEYSNNSLKNKIIIVGD
ncbi:MAG: aspartate kinase [Thermoplasmata archaeon]